MQKIVQQNIEELNHEGYCLIKHFFSNSEIKKLQNLLHLTQNLRFCLDKVDELKPYAKMINDELQSLSEKLIFNRSILFNKTAEKNWGVLWHQDKTICLKEKVQVEGYRPWSIKEGVPHVQPPVHILKSMITARLHIDDSSSENGALKIIPKSHHKIFSQKEIVTMTNKNKTISANKGDLLLMKPLLLHSSDSSINNARPRRVLHLEFFTKELDKNLVPYHSQPFL